MYFNGTIGLDIEGTEVKIRKPSNFFGSIANAVTGGRFETQEEQETYRMMALAQGINRSLRELGINNIIRLAIDDRVIYEDKEHREDDYKEAMDALETSDIDPAGLDLNELDIICEHDDGTLHYVIDFDIFRFHAPGEDPITIKVMGVPAQMRRGEEETEEAFESRVRPVFSDQARLDKFKNEHEARFNSFIGPLKSSLKKHLGIKAEKIETRLKTCLPMKVEKDKYIKKEYGQYTRFDPSLTYYDPWWDLYYLHYMGEALTDHDEIRMKDVSVVDPGDGVSHDYGLWGINGGEYGALVAPVSDSGAGASFGAGTVSSDSGGGAALETASVSSDSGGGGWLSSIGDFVSDVGSSIGDAVGGDSSCGGCGGCGG